ncbi:MAG: hypothetical protein KIT84_15690 [Labilithrix sp.]|nr:hypothetical protein [Labilithrix sp.]MCW5812469.1 hypothetical protein [Labilithrix sp.]
MQKTFGAWLAVVALAGSSALNAGCSCNPACQFRGTINQPENLSMRRSMLRKAMGDFCKQMKSRNAPLKLSADSPVIGRFYPSQCTASEGDTLHVTFAGMGYAWTNVTKKVTFNGGGSAAFRYDFQVTDGDQCDIYSYFRPQRIDASNFQTHRIESPLATMFAGISSLGNDFGKQTLAQKLQEGFTVIAKDGSEANVELALGIVPLGKKPFHPYQVERGDGRVTYENERTEVHQNQRDFIGPIVVEEEKKAIYLTAAVDGIPAIDVLVMRKADAEQSLGLYYEYAQSGPLQGTPMRSEVLAQGNQLKRSIVVPPGTYYIVLDNTPTAGQVAPVVNALDDRAAVVNYLIQIGDAS